MNKGHLETSIKKSGLIYATNLPLGCSPEHQKMIAHLPSGVLFFRGR
jgi:hypothetical protein